MANFTIQSKTTLTSVDRAADLFVLADASASNAVKNTTVNYMLDLTSHPVGVDDTQTLTNKTIGNSNTVTFRDDRFTLQDNSDTTKQAVFQLSGITTATTRTYTLPNATTTLVGTDATQTLTNKTLTSPTINTATISNPTLTTDVVSEHTAANGVTVDGVNLKDGLINTANSIDSAAYIDGSIDPEHLLSGTGTSCVWQSWIPTWTNVSGGTTDYAKYIQQGKTVHFRIRYTLAGAGVSGDVIFSLPVTSVSAYQTDDTINGTGMFLDAGTQGYPAYLNWRSTTTISIRPIGTGGSYATFGTLASSTVPFSFGNLDVIQASGSYEAN